MYHDRRILGGDAFAGIDWTWIDAGEVRRRLDDFGEKPTTLPLSGRATCVSLCLETMSMVWSISRAARI
jgi:hypothetical protein